MEAGPHRRDRPPVVHGHGHAVIAGLERRLDGAHDLEVRLEARAAGAPEAPLGSQGGEQARQVTAGLRQVGPFQLDLVQPHDRVDDEVADRDAFPDDLPSVLKDTVDRLDRLIEEATEESEKSKATRALAHLYKLLQNQHATGGSGL